METIQLTGTLKGNTKIEYVFFFMIINGDPKTFASHKFIGAN